MGDLINGTVAGFLATECSGFINETSRSFLRRHSNSESLLGQLKALYLKGCHQACKDLVQLICEEQHPLCESADLYVLRAKIALEEEESLYAVNIWLTQARLNDPEAEELRNMDKIVRGLRDLKDGVYQEGTVGLSNIHEDRGVGFLASFLLGRHLLWKSRNIGLAIFHLENALQTKPYLKGAWEALGFAYNRDGQRERAQTAFAKCIELETDPEKLTFYRQQLAS